jgi:putative ABC transport system permease protein
MQLRQHPFRANEAELVVRTASNPEALIPAVQNTIHELNPEVATKFSTMNELLSDSIGAQRFRTALASTFAILALLLALSGVYAVMSYVTTRRTAEFGLRSALGAQPANIVGLVLGGAARLAALGVVAGVLLSLAAGRLRGAMLVGLKSTDPLTYAAVIAFVLPVIVLAASLPASRASSVDPMIALRSE